jgi:3-hydroxyisobutyrate dehydrogenase
MGRLMAAHVLSAGHELTIWNRTPGKADELTSRGAQEAASVKEAVKDVDAVVMMLFGGDSSFEVLEAVSGAAPAGALVIDATTTGPDAARASAATAAEHGLRYVDAPVAGSLAPAQEGTLTVFVGGSDDDVEAARPLLELWGAPERIRHIGPVGAANALKSVVNMCLGVAMAGVGEALKLGNDLALDRAVLLDALEAGPFGWSVKQKRAMLDSGKFTPTTFSLDLMSKDLTVALDAAAGELPLTAVSLALANAASTAGFGDDDYAAMAGYRADSGA